MQSQHVRLFRARIQTTRNVVTYLCRYGIYQIVALFVAQQLNIELVVAVIIVAIQNIHQSLNDCGGKGRLFGGLYSVWVVVIWGMCDGEKLETTMGTGTAPRLIHEG